MSLHPPARTKVEFLVYGSGSAGAAGVAAAVSVRASALYRLYVPALAATFVPQPGPGAGPGAGRLPSRVARLTLGGWRELETAALVEPPGREGPTELGVCLAAPSPDAAGFSLETAAPTLSVDVHVGPDGVGLTAMRFRILCANQYGGRPLALRARWLDDGMPLPGAGVGGVRLIVGGDFAAPPAPLTLDWAVPHGPAAAPKGGGPSPRAALARRRSLPSAAGPAAQPRSPAAQPRPPAGAAARQRAAGAGAGPGRSPPGAGAAGEAGQSGTPSPLHSGSEGAQPSPPSAASPGPPPPAEPEADPLLIAAEIAATIPVHAASADDPIGSIRALSIVVADHQDWMHAIVLRLGEELQRRSRSHPTLDSLARLAHVLVELEAAGVDEPVPPPPCGTLFAMDALTRPDEARRGGPLPPWQPPPPPHFGPAYVARLEQAFAGMRSAGAGAAPSVAAVSVLLEDALLLSPLVRTAGGRSRLRALLVALREYTACMAPVLKIASHLADAAVRRLRARGGAVEGDDAVRNALEAVEALRPPMRNACPDLFPLTFPRAMEVLLGAKEAALELAGPGGPAAPPSLLYAEVVERIGEQMVTEGKLEEGIQSLFEAWSIVLRAGASPSRIDSRIILFLTEAHLLHPTAYQLAERLYWCTEGAEDGHTEARACNLLVWLAASSGRAADGRAYVDRVLSVQSSLPPHEHEREAAGFLAAAVAVPMLLRAGRPQDCFEFARVAQAALRRVPDAAHPSLDIVGGGFRLLSRCPALLPSFVHAARFALFMAAIADPEEGTAALFLALAGLGEVHARQGQWRRAEVAYAHALEAASRLPRAFPPDHPRILRLAEALRRCRENGRQPQPAARAGVDHGEGELDLVAML